MNDEIIRRLIRCDMMTSQIEILTTKISEDNILYKGILSFGLFRQKIIFTFTGNNLIDVVQKCMEKVQTNLCYLVSENEETYSHLSDIQSSRNIEVILSKISVYNPNTDMLVRGVQDAIDVLEDTNQVKDYY